MRAYRQLVTTQLKITLREPADLFFALIFGPMLVLALGLIFGNKPVPEFHGLGYLDGALAPFAAMVVAIVGLMSVPIDIVTQRESGTLRRLRATPLSPRVYIAADVTVRFIITFVGTMLAFAVGMVGFGVRPIGNFGSVGLAACLGCAAFLALGYALASIYPTQGVAMGVGNILLILLLMMSGAMVPRAVFSPTIQRISDFSPLTQFVNLLRGLWNGEPWGSLWVPVVVLGVMLVVCTAVATRLFRWEPSGTS
jgi:ABC-2 type transport system permease protein